MALVAWQKFITDAAGNIIDGAEVRVYDPGTTTKNAIYQDRAGNTQWSNNVALSDANGLVLLYVANGRYDIEVTKGSSTVLYEDVLLSEIQALDVGKTIGDIPQYEDDGNGNPVLDAAALHKGALVTIDSNQSIPDVTFAFISWDSQAYDTDGIWDSGDPTKLIVPSNVKKVRLSCGLRWADAASSSNEYFTMIDKNRGSAGDGPNFIGGTSTWYGSDGGGRAAEVVITPVVNVNPGDHFTVSVQQKSGGSLSLQSVNTWFSMEIVEYTH